MLYWMNPLDYGYNEGKGNGDKHSDHFQDTNKVIIYSAYLDMVVNNSDSVNHRLSDIAKKNNGYTQTLGTTQSIIRVEASNFQQAIKEIATIGTITNKSIKGEDVTESYWDFKIRLDNANKAREAYLVLLKKAENVEAALKVEKELERLNGEIDGLEGKMQKLKHLATYSTITVNLKPKVKPGILGYVGIGLYKGIKWLFVR
jgi:Domain of unknown function (DUF4349)